MQTFIRIHPGDSVAVALQPLAAGTVILAEGNPLTLQEDIPQGHKFALIPIRAGEPVIKYGAPIGTAGRRYSAGIMGSYRESENRPGRHTGLCLPALPFPSGSP